MPRGDGSLEIANIPRVKTISKKVPKKSRTVSELLVKAPTKAGGIRVAEIIKKVGALNFLGGLRYKSSATPRRAPIVKGKPEIERI
jgi:hypothetical protein